MKTNCSRKRIKNQGISMQQPAMHSYVCGIKRSENFLTSLYHKRRNAYAMACHSLIFDSRPGEVVFHIRPDVERWIVW